MTPPVSNPWTTDPEYIDLLNFIIERTENVESPINIQQLVRDFKEKSGTVQTVNCLKHRIRRMRKRIHSFEHIDTETRVKLLFAFNVSVNTDFLEEIRKNALVEVDENNRITHYKANDGSLELRGDHSLSVKTTTGKLESKGSIQSSVIDCFNKETTADAVSRNEVEREMRNLIEFITEKCENVNSPLSTTRLADDFNEQFGTSIPSATIRTRIKSYCYEIQNVEYMDTPSKVKQLFGLSATLASNYLTELRKDAVVEVDELNRITKYAANNGGLTLHGDHSQSAKQRTAQLAAKRSNRSLINNHFENKTVADVVPKTEEEKEMGNFIEFITEKCKNVSSPLSIGQLTKDFNQHFGIGRSSNCIFKRVKRYCREIQKTEFMDTHSKVRQLFCLSAKLDSDFLEELRKDADVEVDELNRITKYTANNGSLTLNGEHSLSAKGKLAWNEKRNKRNTIENYFNSGGNEDKEGENEDSEEENEEFGNEFNSDDENDHLDETEDFMGLLNETNNFDNEISIRNRPEMSVYDSFDFDLPTERLHRSEELEMKPKDDGGKKNDNKNPKRKNSTPTASASAKKRNKGTTGSSSSNWNGSSSNDSMRPNELDDYDTNYSIDDQVNFEPFFGSIQEDLNGIQGDEIFQQISKLLQAPQALEQHNQVLEVPIEMEHEEHVEIKPETYHNSKIKFFEAMQSLILFLNTPSLSWIQSKIHQKIQSIEGQDEVIQNNEISLIIQLLIARVTNHSVVNLSKNVESVNLSFFLCYLKAAILNSKMSGVADLVENISKLIEESQDKRIPMEKVANALLVTLNIDGL